MEDPAAMLALARGEARLDCERLLQLASSLQRAILSRRLVGLDEAPIAEERGIPVATVASIASRGIQQIRDRLKASDLPHDYAITSTL